MKCPKCGKDTVAEAVYCHHCGERLPLADDVAQTAVEQFKDSVASRQSLRDEPEQELWAGGYSSRAMWSTWAMLGVASLALIVLAIVFSFNTTGWLLAIGAIVLGWLYYLLVFARRRLGVRFRLTSQRLFHERGLLWHVVDRIEVIDVDDVASEQSPLDRLAGVGTIRIRSSDRSQPVLVLSGIEDPKRVSGLIDQARRREQIRRGLHIDQV